MPLQARSSSIIRHLADALLYLTISTKIPTCIINRKKVIEVIEVIEEEDDELIEEPQAIKRTKKPKSNPSLTQMLDLR